MDITKRRESARRDVRRKAHALKAAVSSLLDDVLVIGGHAPTRLEALYRAVERFEHGFGDLKGATRRLLPPAPRGGSTNYRKCPQCERTFSPQGIANHLRHSHSDKTDAAA